MAVFVVRYYLETGALTHDMLMQQVDWHLDALAIELFKIDFGSTPGQVLGSHFDPHAEAHPTLAGALARERQIRRENPQAIVMIEYLKPKTGTGGKILTRDEYGRVDEFRALRARLDVELQQLITPNNPYRLYWFDGSHFAEHPTFRDAAASHERWKRALIKRL